MTAHYYNSANDANGNMLTRTGVEIPETVRDQFPEHYRLRIGVWHRLNGSMHYREQGRFVGGFDIFLVATNEAPEHDRHYEYIASLTGTPRDFSASFVREAKELAADPVRLTNILTQDLAPSATR